VLFRSWSVSALVGADFSQVSVSARSVTTGQTLPVTLEPQYSGYGLNTLVFVLQPPARGSSDHWVEVTVRNIGSSSGSRDFVYQVRLMPDL